MKQRYGELGINHTKHAHFFFRWRIFIYSLFKSWYCQLNFNVRSDLFSYNYVCFFSLFSILSCGIMVLFIYLCEHIFFLPSDFNWNRQNRPIFGINPTKRKRANKLNSRTYWWDFKLHELSHWISSWWTNAGLFSRQSALFIIQCRVNFIWFGLWITHRLKIIDKIPWMHSHDAMNSEHKCK